MKRFLPAFVLAAGVAGNAWSTSGTYTIYGNQTVTTPPMIDATNFVNLGILSIATLTPFEFSNVRNYTNRNTMQNSFSGFRFDTAPSGSGYRYMAANFYNAPLVPSGSALVYGPSHILVSATNIVNRGLLQVEQGGLVSLDGKKVDTSRGRIQVGMPLANEGISDNYWIFDTGRLIPAQNFVEQYPSVPFFNVVTYGDFTNSASLDLTDFSGTDLTSAEYIEQAGTNQTVQIIFVRNLNPGITVDIRSTGGTPEQFGVPMIEWSHEYTNGFGDLATNTLYLTDTYGANLTNLYFTNLIYAPAYTWTLQPRNFTISRAQPALFESASTGPAFTDRPADFWSAGGPVVTNAQYSAYSVTVNPVVATRPGTTARNAAGRIEMIAGQVLDLNLAHVETLNYLKLTATNHFAGASNAFVSAPFADIALGSTNGMLKMSSVLVPAVTRFTGNIEIYSAVWTNDVVIGGETNSSIFNVILVDSFLSEALPPQIFDLSLRSTNLIVGDILNVSSNLVLDVDNLTISNVAAFNLLSYDLHWAESATHLKNLTNQGAIFAPNDLFFVSRNADGSDRPYSSFVNEGYVDGSALSVASDSIVNPGYLFANYGPISLVAATNVTLPAGGELYAPYGDITIACKNLSVTNHLFTVGRGITLTVTGNLMAGVNNWEVYDGFNLLARPATGDFSSSSVTSYAMDYQEVISTWAGADLGPVPAGFTNNAALGRLTLDGGLYSLFTFVGTGPGSNALYVDVLVLENMATNLDGGGNMEALNLVPGMKIYFGQAFAGSTDITAALAGKNGGALVNVPHTGPLSLSKPAPPLDVNLKVSIATTPAPRSLVTWNTEMNATNHLYYVEQPMATNWQLVTNFISPASGPVTITDEDLKNSRFYKVRVDRPGL